MPITDGKYGSAHVLGEGGTYLQDEVLVRVLGHVHQVQHHVAHRAMLIHVDLAFQFGGAVHPPQRPPAVRCLAAGEAFLGLQTTIQCAVYALGVPSVESNSV